LGRLPQTEPRKYQIEMLWDNHKEIIRRLALGQSAVRIAHDLRVTPSVVSYVRNSIIGRKELDNLQDKMDEEVVTMGRRIRELAPDALALVEAVINNDTEYLDGLTAPTHLRLNAAQDLLEKAGYAAPRRIEGSVLHGYIGRMELDEIKARAKDSMNVVRSNDASEAEDVEFNNIQGEDNGV